MLKRHPAQPDVVNAHDDAVPVVTALRANKCVAAVENGYPRSRPLQGDKFAGEIQGGADVIGSSTDHDRVAVRDGQIIDRVLDRYIGGAYVVWCVAACAVAFVSDARLGDVVGGASSSLVGHRAADPAGEVGLRNAADHTVRRRYRVAGKERAIDSKCR